ncbi:hypothetical protein HXX76_000388 [Chlamydomonas incerta]|uniref:protein-serine/threonine phosphatase n=1 Tax=Chlamydomonas incerta TaxID=51695 RepID=A0A835WE14_CHLIN|nr:hypothetical protein HXX76_000388 [Chlamydomonas incerta]|eukprot:KAG2445784.1 hypothetical protein HXX76_000388 [Chlamydomonas incerta]
MQAAKLAAEDAAPASGATMPSELRVTPVDASLLGRAPAAQAASVSGQTSNASKFALPQANVMAVLRSAYYGNVQHFHRAAPLPAATVTNPAPTSTSGGAATASPGRDAAGPGRPAPTEGAQSREAKRLRVGEGANGSQPENRGSPPDPSAGASVAQGRSPMSAAAFTAARPPSALGADGGDGGSSSRSGGSSSSSGRPSSGHSASRRGAAALKRLCAALGVCIQRDHLPEHGLSFAVASSRGWRAAMEDCYAAEVPLGGTGGRVALFSLFDGHGGAEVARYSALHMVGGWGRAIREAPSFPAAPATPAASPAASGAEPKAASARAVHQPAASPAGAAAGCGSGRCGLTITPLDVGQLGCGIGIGVPGPMDAGLQPSDKLGQPLWPAGGPGPASPPSRQPPPPLQPLRLASVVAAAPAAAMAAAPASGAEHSTPSSPVPAFSSLADDYSPTASLRTAAKTAAATAAGAAGAGQSHPAVPTAAAAAATAAPACYAAALREAFLSLDQRLAAPAQAAQLLALANPGAVTAPPETYGRRTPDGPFLGPAAGSTATVALVGPGGITVAGVGDSRCILGCRRGGVAALSVDHKGSDPAERERVLRAGSWVSASGRVCGELDMSRALGDADLKQAPGLSPLQQAVTAEPAVLHAPLRPVPPPLAAQRGCGQELEQQQQRLAARGLTPRGRLRGHGKGDSGEEEREDSSGSDDSGSGGGGVEEEAPADEAEQVVEQRLMSVMHVGGSSDRRSSSGSSAAGAAREGDAAMAAAVDAADEHHAKQGQTSAAAAGGAPACAPATAVAQPAAAALPPLCLGGAAPLTVPPPPPGCYLLLASDGLWNVMDTQQVHEFVVERLEAGLPADVICAQLCVESCVSEKTAYDNVTALMVLLHGVEPVTATGADAAPAAATAAASSPLVQPLAGVPAGLAATPAATVPLGGCGLPPLSAVLPGTVPPVTIAPVSRASSAGAAAGAAAVTRPGQPSPRSAAAMVAATMAAAAAASTRAVHMHMTAPQALAVGAAAAAAAASHAAAPEFGRRDQDGDMEMRDAAAGGAAANYSNDSARPATSPKPVLPMSNQERSCRAMEWQTEEVKKSSQELNKVQEPIKPKLQERELQDVENCRDVLETGITVDARVGAGGEEGEESASGLGADATCSVWSKCPAAACSSGSGSASGLEERAPEAQRCESAGKLRLACGRETDVAARGGSDAGGGSEWGSDVEAGVSERLLEASPSFHDESA